MTKLEAMALSEGLTRLVVGMESDLIQNIAVFLASGQAETSAALWKIKKLAELGALTKKNKQTIAEYAEIQPEMQQITIEAAAIKAIEQVEPGFRQLVKEGILNDAAEMPMSDTMARVIKALGKQAKSDLNLVNTTMLYKAKKAAEKVINDTAELANKQEFLDSLNKAAGKVVTGVESRQAAMRQCIGEMTEKGIPAFTDKLGREWSPEAYTSMCIRTTVAKTATETQMERMNDYGVNLVAVSSHIGARPLCAPYQGRIFDRNNGSGYTTDLNDNKIRYEPWSSTSYGKPAGLLGINCGHQIYPFIPGINVQRYFPYDEAENAEQYKKVQKQRQLEREVRAAKRECTALDTVGDKAGFDEAAVRLKEKQKKLQDYCSSNGLTYKPDRTATPGYGKSEAAKVTASYKKSLEIEKLKIQLFDIDNSPEDVIIKLQGKLSDVEVRKWYLSQDKRIPEQIDKSLPIEEQARQACNLRNKYRTQARDLMKNQEKRKQLDISDPNMSFEELIDKKMKQKNLTREKAIEDILKTSTKTRKSVNTALGLEE